MCEQIALNKRSKQEVWISLRHLSRRRLPLLHYKPRHNRLWFGRGVGAVAVRDVERRAATRRRQKVCGSVELGTG